MKNLYTDTDIYCTQTIKPIQMQWENKGSHRSYIGYFGGYKAEVEIKYLPQGNQKPELPSVSSMPVK